MITKEQFSEYREILTAHFLNVAPSEKEPELKEDLKGLLGYDISRRDLIAIFNQASLAEDNSLFIVYPVDVPGDRVWYFWKTENDQFEELSKYISSLETNSFTNLRFFGLIKLAFVNLFRRS